MSKRLRGKSVRTLRRLVLALLLLSPAFGTAPGADGTAYAVVHHFQGPEGGSPRSRLVLAADGKLYGTACGGGAFGDGSAFRFDPPATLTRLHSFKAGTDG